MEFNNLKSKLILKCIRMIHYYFYRLFSVYFISCLYRQKLKRMLYSFFVIFSFNVTVSGNINSQLGKVDVIPMLRLMMSGIPNYLDESVIYYQNGATNAFDSQYDAYKLFGPNPAPHISLDLDSLLLAINGISPVNQSYTTSILATTPVSGNFTITATDYANLPNGTCVYLTDLLMGTTVDIL